MVRLGLWVLVFAATASTAQDATRTETAIASVAESLPSWLDGGAQFVYLVAGLYAFALVLGVGLVARGRKSVFRDFLIGIAAFVIALIFVATVWRSKAVVQLDPKNREA